jgi:hypothetical protein
MWNQNGTRAHRRNAVRTNARNGTLLRNEMEMEGMDRGPGLFQVRVLSHTYGTYDLVEKQSVITKRCLKEIN